MSETIITVEKLSKRYTIQHQSNRNDGFRHILEEKLKAPFRRLFGRNGSAGENQKTSEDFWALRDITFDVKRGEVVGIIGRNGAGKSTLLKILSRITEPTEGSIRLRGRVASLLEVGTGFHPELTGRENIYLNGSILGMSKAEIKRKFDEIVAFSEVEKFLDTPVKRYSSGMYVRLAFAVAAHLEPEILIVDEVLAVGDAEFQKKCLGKMQDVAARQGRTVLFVSHNMAAVTTLTERTVLLDKGRVQFAGPTATGVQQYLQGAERVKGFYRSPKTDDAKPFVSKMAINSVRGESTHISGNPMIIIVEIMHREPINGACFSIQILNQWQHPVIHCWIYDSDMAFCRKNGPTILKCEIPRLALNVGSYSMNTYLSEPPGGKFFETLESVCSFDVEIVGKQNLFGWRPDACAYIEEQRWTVS